MVFARFFLKKPAAQNDETATADPAADAVAVVSSDNIPNATTKRWADPHAEVTSPRRWTVGRARNADPITDDLPRSLVNNGSSDTLPSRDRCLRFTRDFRLPDSLALEYPPPRRSSTYDASVPSIVQRSSRREPSKLGASSLRRYSLQILRFERMIFLDA